MDHRLAPIAYALFSLTLFVPSLSLANPYQEFDRIIRTLEANGYNAEAADLELALARVPEAQFRAISEGLDLDHMASAFEVAMAVSGELMMLPQEMSARVASQVQGALVQSSTIHDYPHDLPGSSSTCPSYPGFDTSAPDYNAAWADSLIAVETVRVAYYILKAISVAASKVCDETVVVLGEGGNTAAACLPFAIASSVAKAVYGSALGAANIVGAEGRTKAYCNARIAGLYAKNSNERLVALKTDLDTAVTTLEGILAGDVVTIDGKIADVKTELDNFRLDVDFRLGKLQADMDTVLTILKGDGLSGHGGARWNDAYHSGGTGSERLTEVCNRAQDALDQAKIFYKVGVRAQTLISRGNKLISLENQPRKGFEACRTAYRLATDKAYRLSSGEDVKQVTCTVED